MKDKDYPRYPRQQVPLDPDLWRRVKIRAIEEGRANWQIVQDALTAYLEKGAKP